MRIQLSGNWISKYWKFPLLYHSHFTLPNILLDLSQHMLADAEHIAEAFAAHIDPADVPLPEAASCLLLGDHTILKVGNTRHRAIHVNGQPTRVLFRHHAYIFARDTHIANNVQVTLVQGLSFDTLGEVHNMR